MARYVAITRQGEHWEYLYAGIDPQEVYLQAVRMIEQPAFGLDDTHEMDGGVLPPNSERQLDSLRVVTDSIAEEVYHVRYPYRLVEEF